MKSSDGIARRADRAEIMMDNALTTSRIECAPRLHLDSAIFREKFDHEPFGFSHNLSGLDVFKPEALADLVRRFDQQPRDYFVSAGAPSAGAEFFKVPHGQCTPSEAMARLNSAAIRILLKRPENHDPAFRRLLDALFAQVVALRGGLGSERLVRLESAVFITSAASTTPFHFDPEINFFSQIEGEKTYHVYAPASVREIDLEDFYLQGQVSIGQVDLRKCDPVHEHVYTLRAGDGFHQPQNSPHWVQTQASRSISYSFVFETDATRARGRARACNHYLRKMGIDPFVPGGHPARDALKAGAMRMLIPLRQAVSAKLRSLRGPRSP
jgi:hypothetical protein